VLQQFQNQELSIRLYILCSIPEDPDKTCENDVYDEKFAYSFLFKEWIRNTSYFLPLLISSILTAGDLFGAAVTCFLKVYVTEGNLSEIQEKETDP
jgi:hypothetical protein